MPAIITSAALLAVSIALWPGVLRNVVSLDWQLGNMRLIAYGLQMVAAGLALMILIRRHRVNEFYRNLFPNPRRVAFAFLAVAISLSVCLTGVELAMRLFNYPFPARFTPPENAMARFDPEVGWSYVPHRSVVQRFGSNRRAVPMHFDEIGARVGAAGDKTDPAAPAVLFVGGSFTMGHGVPHEESFVGQLNDSPDFPYQVVNLGVQAYGTDQSLLLLKRHFQRFNTRAVVYVYIADHVTRNANHDRRLLLPKFRSLGTKPQFDLRRDGSLYLRRSPAQYDEMPNLHIWQCIQLAWTKWGPRPNPELTRALIQAMKDYVESNGAIFILLPWPGVFAPDMDTTGQVDWIDTFRDLPQDWDQWVIPGDPHPDRRAHAHIARLIVEKFRTLDMKHNSGF